MIATVCSSKFDYDAKSRTFVAELSEARENFEGGFYIRSAKTGAVRLFLYDRTDTDGEDIHGWWYFCPAENLKALIIND